MSGRIRDVLLHISNVVSTHLSESTANASQMNIIMTGVFKSYQTGRHDRPFQLSGRDYSYEWHTIRYGETYLHQYFVKENYFFTEALLNKIQSTLDISKLWGLFFTSSNYPKCKLIWTCKKYPTPNYGWKKQSKSLFDSDRRFEFRRIRDIQVRDNEIRLYVTSVKRTRAPIFS